MRRFAITAAMAMAAVGGPGAPGAWGQCTANELAKLTASDGAPFDFFGLSVAISGDMAVIGAPGDDDAGESSGSAYAYRFDPEGSGQWVQEQELTASDAAAGDSFGGSVSISGDVALIAAVGDDDAGGASGSAYVFRFDPQTSRWHEEAKLTASDADEGDLFGWSVSISGDVAVVGAYHNDDAGTNSGSAYVYRFDHTIGVWVEQAKLTASDTEAHDQFGWSVSITGDVAVIGALNEGNCCGRFPSDGPGAAYVYRFDPAGSRQWVHEQKLLASDGEDGDRFTESVSISGDTIVIGATGDDDAGPRSGSAYVYRFQGEWVQERKLTASDAFTEDRFGHSVSVTGDMALVGAPQPFNGGPGAAYVYRFNQTSGQWLEQAKLTASDGATEDFFGESVSISPDGIGVIGARNDDDAGSQSGSAYIFAGLADCNENGALDLCDIADDTSRDANSNGVPDECERPDCPADLNGNGIVGILDLLALLAAWGTDPGGPPDFDGDGTVGILDLLELLAHWGPCP